MWTRKELKAQGKTALKRNYGKTLLVGLVLAVVSGGITIPQFTAKVNSEELSAQFQNMGSEELAAFLAVFIGVFAVASLFAIALSVFVFHPLAVGCQRYFVQNNAAPADPKEMGYGFKTNYKNVILTMFLTNLFISLWSLLFIIPGIVKSYSYRMVPYLLTDDPNMNYKDALNRSKEMMMGQKWNAFILDLSFIGWKVLAAFTFGLLDILYVNPYMYGTNAELYRTLKGDAQAPAVAEAPIA